VGQNPDIDPMRLSTGPPFRFQLRHLTQNPLCHFAANFPLSELTSLVPHNPCRGTGIFITRACEIVGKTRHFGLYLLCGLFDTLENRVITSGLTLASFWKHFGYPNQARGALTLAKDGGCLNPRRDGSGISY